MAACTAPRLSSHLIYLHLSSGYTLYSVWIWVHMPLQQPSGQETGDLCHWVLWQACLGTPLHHSAASDESNRTTGVMMTEPNRSSTRQRGKGMGRKRDRLEVGGLVQPAKPESVQGQPPPGRVCPQLLRGPTGPSGDCLCLAEQGCVDSHRDATSTWMLLQP